MTRLSPYLHLRPLAARLCCFFAAGCLILNIGLRASAQPDAAIDPTEAQRLAPVEIPGITQTPKTSEPAVTPAADASQLGITYDPREAERFRVLRKSMSPVEEGQYELRVKPLEGFIDYDEVEQVIYGAKRTQIWYGKYFLEADKVILDNRLQEVQAQGNVIFRSTEVGYEGTEIHADSMRYNFAEGEGVGFNVTGTHAPIYFKAPSTEDANLPPLQQVSSQESLFRNAAVTTCDFTIPHYSIRGREIIMFVNDKVFIRGATLRVWNVPVLYLPYFVRRLDEPGPWFYQLGYSDKTGFRVRLGYNFEHLTEEPSFEKDDQYSMRSQGTASVFADYMTKRGFGGGFNYLYSLDFEKHIGEFRAYGINDSERKVSADPVPTPIGAIGEDAILKPNTKSEEERSAILWRNRTEFTKHLYATVNVDWFSDPEIFYDVLDRFSLDQERRYRVMERRASGALTYLREAYVARLMISAKDRIGLDRYSKFSDPGDNNRDFEFEPGFFLEDSEADSIANKRWGRVSEKYPQFTAATRYLPIRQWPLYFMTDVNAYNNLDKGLNVVSSDDDARVKGIDLYSQLLWQYRITERYVLIAKIGAGVGLADRDRDDLGVEPEDIYVDPLTLRTYVDTLELVDDDGTFIVGQEKFNLADIEPFYALGDTEFRFNARFSDALSGYLLWKFRETTDDFIGDFYARLGDLTSRDDLYNYRLRHHNVQGNLTYRLVHPSLYFFGNVAANLKSKSELFANEEIGFWNIGGGWTNRRNTLNISSSLGWTRRQIFVPSDTRSGEQDNNFFRTDLRYSPIHGRWYTRLRYEHDKTKGQRTEEEDDELFTFFTDEEPRDSVEVTYGRELGPKWNSAIEFEWDSQIEGFREVSWILQRDLHDAIATLRVRSERDIEEADSRDDNAQMLDVSLGLNFKLPERPVAAGPQKVRGLKQNDKQPALAF